MPKRSDRAILPPTPPPGTVVALRGPSGRLYGYFDPKRLTIEVKRKGEAPERIDLKPLLGQ